MDVLKKSKNEDAISLILNDEIEIINDSNRSTMNVSEN